MHNKTSKMFLFALTAVTGFIALEVTDWYIPVTLFLAFLSLDVIINP
jgi:hypothetical protein